MKQKYNKKYLKTNFISFIIALIIFGSIGVYAAITFPSNDVSYDNSVSGLKSTSVKDAIDELYGACTAEKVDIGGIEVPVVDDGDGLYEDEYENGRYFYKGANPNNYLTFNEEQAGWRILSIEPDKAIKIMKTENINTSDNIAWDTSESGNWARPATLNTYLNETYYNGLNSTAQSQVVAKDWSIGALTSFNYDLAAQVNDENSAKWNGKIALPTASEYIRTNSNKSSCGTFQQLWFYSSNNQCGQTTWVNLNKDAGWWTLTPNGGNDTGSIFIVDGFTGNFLADMVLFRYYGVQPTLYLSSEVKITGGTGTQSDPYTIE